MQEHLLSFLIFLPAAAALVLLLVPSAQKEVFKRGTLLVCLIQLLTGVVMALRYDASRSFQFEEHHSWITMNLGTWGTWQADYWVGVDGLSFPLVLMSILILLIAAFAARKINHHEKGFFTLFLVLDAAIMGSFTALDLLLFYLFFEFMLLPMYFMIGIWGGQRREYASMKFFLYTLLGSLLILIVFIGVYLASAVPGAETLTHTFSIPLLLDPVNYSNVAVLSPASTATLSALTYREWAFLFLLVGFAIKLPAVPVHTWLPDAHVEAPTAVSVVLAAILLKIGGYGIIRLAYPLFPHEAVGFSWLVAGLGVVSIIYGALNCLASKDLKRLIAYSSVSHMGFVLLGVSTATGSGLSGAMFQMVSHGVLSAMLFLLAGMLEERTGNRLIENHSGLASRFPEYTFFVLVAFFGALGLPGFSGFIGELLVLLAAFTSAATNGYVHVAFGFIALSGLILAAAYFLWAIQRMFFGPFSLKQESSKLRDLSFADYCLLLPLGVLTLALGVYPQPLLNILNTYTHYWLTLVTTAP